VRYANLVEFLQEMYRGHEPPPDADYTNASWVSWRLAELLPVGNDIRQRWLAQRDPVMRLGEIRDELEKLANKHPE